MDAISDFHDYICGGYFLTKRVNRPSDVSNLVPESVVTVSACFTAIAPDTWADADYRYEDQERVEEAARFGIPAAVVPELVNMFTQAVRPHHLANAFPNLPVAQEFYRHCTDKGVVALLGIGLERSLLPSVHPQLKDEVNRGYGLIEFLNADAPLERGGIALGYEPLGFDGTKFHSWLCHNAPVDAYDRFGIRPNSSGFIDSFTEAVRVTQNLKATGAEPGIWEPWLVVRYGIPEASQDAVKS